MDNSSKNTKNHPNLESCGKIRESGLFSGEFADKKRKWKSKSCSEDLNIKIGFNTHPTTNFLPEPWQNRKIQFGKRTIQAKAIPQICSKGWGRGEYSSNDSYIVNSFGDGRYV